MAYYKIQGETLTGIAEVIRAKNGTSNLYNPTEMATAIGTIKTGGSALNMAYGDSAPENTSKLWIKTAEPVAVRVTAGAVVGNEDIQEFIADIPEGACSMASATVGTKVYLFGGRNGGITTTYLNAIHVFDTETRTLSTLSVTLPTGAYEMAATAIGKKIYLFGGNGGSYLSAIHVFDTETETLSTLNTAGPSYAGMTAVAVDEKVYLFGGWYNESRRSIISMFNSKTNTYTSLNASLPEGAANISAVLIGTKVYLFGGNGASGTCLTKICVFDTETCTVSTLDTTLPTGAYGMSAALIGTKVYLFGGRIGSTTCQNTICAFDTETNTLSTLNTTLPINAALMASGTVGTKVYLFGGDRSQWSYTSAIHEFVAALPLAENNLLIEASHTKNMVSLVTGDGAAVELG